MPATAGRVRMPANNRVHSSAALQTHGIWQSAIGYDPYAPSKEEKNSNPSQKSSVAEPDSENAYASFQGLLALARITGSNADEARGSCKKCGRVGHLTFQCRNFLSAKNEEDKSKETDIQAAVLLGLEKLKGERVKMQGKGGEESSEEEESESSDSEYDSEIERAIAEKYGKRFSGGKSGKSRSSKGRKRSDDSDESDDDGSERESRKRGRSKKRRSSKRGGDSDSDDEDAGRKRRKEKRRKEKRRRRDDDDLSDEEEERKRRRRKSRKEKRRRRSHRHSDDDSSDDSVKERHKRRSRRAVAASDSDGGSDDARVGRDKKRSEKKSRKHRHDKD